MLDSKYQQPVAPPPPRTRSAGSEPSSSGSVPQPPRRRIVLYGAPTRAAHQKQPRSGVPSDTQASGSGAESTGDLPALSGEQPGRPLVPATANTSEGGVEGPRPSPARPIRPLPTSVGPARSNPHTTAQGSVTAPQEPGYRPTGKLFFPPVDRPPRKDPVPTATVSSLPGGLHQHSEGLPPDAPIGPPRPRQSARIHANRAQEQGKCYTFQFSV